MQLPFLSEEEVGSLAISQMIFHVVGPTEDSLDLVDDLIPDTFAPFFLERVRKAAKGMMFDFIDGSPVEQSCSAISADPSVFIAQSKTLAGLFQNNHTGNSSIGGLVIMSLTCSSGALYAIIKFDHESVLAYRLRNAEGKRKAEISEIEQTFSKSSEALQKSALIRLGTPRGELCLRDRSGTRDVTRYFAAFLAARRRHDASGLTKTIAEVALKTAKAHVGDLGVEVVKSIRHRIHDALQKLPGYDPESPDFINAVFGAVAAESPVVVDFHRRMRAERIEDEAFTFDKDAVPRPRLTRIVTNENIQIIYDRQHEQLIQQEDLPGGRKRISIETGGVKELDDYAEPNSRNN